MGVQSETLLKPSHLEEAPPRSVVGIWVVPITPQDEIFVLENLKAKYESQKLPGQLNSPAETYRPNDKGQFLEKTVPRAISEEIGVLEFQPEDVTPLGLIQLPFPDRRVLAAPYLLDVPSKSALTFQPKDDQESTNPSWVKLYEVDQRKLKIGPYEVPLFRSPMQEIVQLIHDRRNGHGFQVIHSQQPLIPQEVFDQLQGH